MKTWQALLGVLGLLLPSAHFIICNLPLFPIEMASSVVLLSDECEFEGESRKKQSKINVIPSR
jgi:hypothetical protein